MKAKFLILTMLSVAMAFMSCSKNEGGKQSVPQSVTVKLPSTRAVEDPVSGGYISNLNNVFVFLLDGPTVKLADEFTPWDISNREKTYENILSDITSVMILANVPAYDMDAVRGLSSVYAIRAYTFSVESQQGGIDNATLSGEGSANLTYSTTEKEYKEAMVDLYALTARFEIGTVVAGLGVEDVKIQGIFINYFYDSSNKYNVVKNTSADHFWDFNFNYGQYTTSPDIYFPNPYLEPTYFDGYSQEVTDGNKCYAYQLFAGYQVPHVILAVSGRYQPGYYDSGTANSEYFVKFVTFKSFDRGGNPLTSIEPNMIYKIGVGSPIIIDADHLTKLPEPLATDLRVMVNVVPWNEENLTPSVNSLP